MLAVQLLWYHTQSCGYRPTTLFISGSSIVTNTQQWLTKAERTNFQETSRYAEDIEFCGRLEKASPYVRFTNFGKSPEGRELPLLIISRDKIFTPEQARQSDSAIILINNGIHAGEISGKEATYMLLRE